MTLVERFIEINGWSTSRKTALLAGLGLVVHLIAWLALHTGLAGTEIVNLSRIDRTHAVGASALALSLVASLAAARAGKDAPWTAYLMVLLYGGFAVVGIQAMGSWSSPYFAYHPMLVVLIALYYGGRIGWFAFGFGMFMTAVVGGLETAGVLPYAPALLDRTVDAQRSAGWIMGTMLQVMLTYVFCFVLGLLVVAAMKLQEARMQAAQKLIRRYVPSQLADEIIKGEHAESFKPERAKLTIFFSDVEGFTDASDQLDAEDLASVLNEYLSEMSVIAERYGATINQFVGDGIMIFFGAPQFSSDRDHALRAVRMALEMQRRLLELKDVWARRGIRKPFRARIGINTGHASVGDFGSEGRKVYSAIGIQTNIAARIQAHCEPGRVLISDSTRALVHEDIPCTDGGELQLKGVHFPVRVYEVDAAQAVIRGRPVTGGMPA